MSLKYDTGKLRWSLLPLHALRDVVHVLEYGAGKYGPHNWQTVPDFETRYYDALERHLVAWRLGETHDAESGLHHLAHAATNALFLLWAARRAPPCPTDQDPYPGVPSP